VVRQRPSGSKRDASKSSKNGCFKIISERPPGSEARASLVRNRQNILLFPKQPLSSLSSSAGPFFFWLDHRCVLFCRFCLTSVQMASNFWHRISYSKRFLMLLLSAQTALLIPGVYCGTLSWSTIGSLAISRGGQWGCGGDVQLVPFGSSLYAFGADSLQANVFKSSNSGISWDKIASNAYSPSRDCFATAVTRSRIYVLGGATCYTPSGFARCQTETHFSSADGVNFVSETAFPDASTAAFFTAVGVTINSIDYVYTSASGCCPYTNTVRRYNTVSKSWETTKSITSDSSGNSYGTRAFTQIKATTDGTLYLAGGHVFDGVYSTGNDLWVSRDYGFTWNKCPLSISQGSGPAIVGYGDTLYIFSQNNMWTTSDRGYTFTPWSQTLDSTPLSSAFDSTTSDYYAVHNGYIFLVKGGGQNVMRSSLVGNQVSNPATEASTTAAKTTATPTTATTTTAPPTTAIPTIAATTAAPTTAVTIASSERVARLPCVPVTLAFTPATPIPSGGTITLTYPSGFFASSITPGVGSGASSVAGLTVTCSPTTATSVVMTTSGATIGASAFTVTIKGFTMGSSGSNVTGGVMVQTSSGGAVGTVSSGPLVCPSGSYWTGQPPTCSPCPAGQYQDSVDASACLPCPAGAYCLEGCASSKGSGMCLQGTYSSAGSGLSSSCSPCPGSRYCSGPSYPKFATFYWSGSSVVYYPSATNTGLPSVSSSPLSLSFSRGNYVNLGSVTLQPGLTGFSATVAAKFTGSPNYWERLFEFGRGTWAWNLILLRVWTGSTIRFDSYQTDQGSYESTAWSETSITPLTHFAQSATILITIFLMICLILSDQVLVRISHLSSQSH